MLICVSCIRLLTVWSFQVLILFLFCSPFELVFLSRYMFEFLHQELSLKKNTRGGVLGWKTLVFVRCIRVLIVQNFPEEPPINTFSRHSSSSSFVTHNHRILFYQSLNKKLFRCENFFVDSFVDCVPCIGILIFRFFQILLFLMFNLHFETLNSP